MGLVDDELEGVAKVVDVAVEVVVVCSCSYCGTVLMS